jgi:hypothetical protein
MNVAMKLTLAGALVLSIAACGSSEQIFPDKDKQAASANGKITGEGGVVLFGDNGRASTPGAVAGIGVNGFLWRASLDSIAFMPLSSADPFGGVIITDWYASPEAPNDRFKITIYVLDRQLRSDAIKVAVFRQTRDYNGVWIDSAVDPKTAGDLENGILTRARQLRLDTTAAQ